MLPLANLAMSVTKSEARVDGFTSSHFRYFPGNSCILPGYFPIVSELKSFHIHICMRFYIYVCVYIFCGYIFCFFVFECVYGWMCVGERVWVGVLCLIVFACVCVCICLYLMYLSLNVPFQMPTTHKMSWFITNQLAKSVSNHVMYLLSSLMNCYSTSAKSQGNAQIKD